VKISFHLFFTRRIMMRRGRLTRIEHDQSELNFLRRRPW